MVGAGPPPTYTEDQYGTTFRQQVRTSTRLVSCIPVISAHEDDRVWSMATVQSNAAGFACDWPRTPPHDPGRHRSRGCATCRHRADQVEPVPSRGILASGVELEDRPRDNGQLKAGP
jgi:hypothetical protein